VSFITNNIVPRPCPDRTPRPRHVAHKSIVPSTPGASDSR